LEEGPRVKNKEVTACLRVVYRDILDLEELKYLPPEVEQPCHLAKRSKEDRVRRRGAGN